MSSLLLGGHEGALTLLSVRDWASREKLSGRADPRPGAPPLAWWRPSQALCPFLWGSGPSRSWRPARGHSPASFCLVKILDCQSWKRSQRVLLQPFTCGEAEAQG